MSQDASLSLVFANHFVHSLLRLHKRIMKEWAGADGFMYKLSNYMVIRQLSYE